MKIIRLEAENVKRLRAIEITPDGTLQVVTGRNAQGKTSVLDAIWLALGGGAASREIPRPVRDGEDAASVTLDLGPLTVTRTWDEKGKTSLTVRAADGAKYSTPQTLLDSLVGQLSFDPLAFTRLSAREQRQALLDLLGLDFEAADRERKRLYDERTDTGRAEHAYGTLPKLPKGAPLTEKSASEILNRISASISADREIERRQDLADEMERSLEGLDRRVANLEAELVKLRDERADLVTRRANAVEAANTLPKGEDRDALDAELAQVEDYNKVARGNRKVYDATEAQKALQQKYTELGQQIAAIDNSKAKALAAATMPVDGLGFDEQGVTYNGVPFQQASSAEQIRVSLAMAMALNPEVRVIRILDGSLLDADSMAAVADMAKAGDYQVWVERVEDASETAVVIEDGQAVTR